MDIGCLHSLPSATVYLVIGATHGGTSPHFFQPGVQPLHFVDAASAGQSMMCYRKKPEVLDIGYSATPFHSLALKVCGRSGNRAAARNLFQSHLEFSCTTFC